jgi:tetratricopeptide (TPR) repeat protein
MNEEIKSDIGANRKTAIIIVAIVIVLIAGAITYRLVAKKNTETTPTSTSQSDTQTNQDSNQSPPVANNFDNKGESTTPTTVPTPDQNSSDPYSFYDAGVTALNSKNYQTAISYFDKALAIRQDDANFYIKKSEAQVSLDQKQQAIDTINKGLTVLPNNELLLNQLDILNNVVK